MAVPLFTSIPPRLPGGSGGSSDPQKALVETWREAGFAPVSINTAVEHDRHPRLRERIASLGVQPLVVERPASPVKDGGSGRLGDLCSVAEVLTAIHGMRPAGAVAIVNADIGMSAGVTAHDVAAVAEATGCVIGQRLDVSAPPGAGRPSEQTMDVNGIDFVAFRAESAPGLEGMLPGGLCFGMPWWDHYLPMSLLVLGCRPRLLRVGSLWHVRHPACWSLGGYTRGGLAVARQFAARLQAMPQTLPVSSWLQLYHNRFHPGFARNRLDRLARRLIEAGVAPELLIRSRVGVLAGETMSLLLQAAAAEV